MARKLAALVRGVIQSCLVGPQQHLLAGQRLRLRHGAVRAGLKALHHGIAQRILQRTGHVDAGISNVIILSVGRMIHLRLIRRLHAGQRLGRGLRRRFGRRRHGRRFRRGLRRRLGGGLRRGAGDQMLHGLHAADGQLRLVVDPLRPLKRLLLSGVQRQLPALVQAVHCAGGAVQHAVHRHGGIVLRLIHDLQPLLLDPLHGVVARGQIQRDAEQRDEHEERDDAQHELDAALPAQLRQPQHHQAHRPQHQQQQHRHDRIGDVLLRLFLLFIVLERGRAVSARPALRAHHVIAVPSPLPENAVRNAWLIPYCLHCHTIPSIIPVQRPPVSADAGR